MKSSGTMGTRNQIIHKSNDETPGIRVIARRACEF